MIGLRRSFRPKITIHDNKTFGDAAGRASVPLRTPNYVTNSRKETSMQSSPPRDWTDMDWSKIGASEPARWIAVLPLAATEQHGPHLPLTTDVLIADAYLARVRELLPDTIPATFLPVEPIGIST